MLDCALNYTSKWQQCNFSISTGSLEMNHKNFEKAKIMVKTNLIQLLPSFPITRVTKIVLKLSLPWVITLPSKWENLSLCSTKLMHFCEKTTTCVGLQVEQIFFVNISYTYFSILGMGFAVYFLFYFRKFKPFVVKNFEIIFVALYFYLYKLKKCVSDF